MITESKQNSQSNSHYIGFDDNIVKLYPSHFIKWVEELEKNGHNKAFYKGIPIRKKFKDLTKEEIFKLPGCDKLGRNFSLDHLRKIMLDNTEFYLKKKWYYISNNSDDQREIMLDGFQYAGIAKNPKEFIKKMIKASQDVMIKAGKNIMKNFIKKGTVLDYLDLYNFSIDCKYDSIAKNIVAYDQETIYATREKERKDQRKAKEEARRERDRKNEEAAAAWREAQRAKNKAAYAKRKAKKEEAKRKAEEEAKRKAEEEAKQTQPKKKETPIPSLLESRRLIKRTPSPSKTEEQSTTKEIEKTNANETSTIKTSLPINRTVLSLSQKSDILKLPGFENLGHYLLKELKSFVRERMRQYTTKTRGFTIKEYMEIYNKNKEAFKPSHETQRRRRKH
ncbi:hypothetical protein M9Y10_013882 [Tritrichomonas musculus]|uniref:Uncharacterized protein n=1 Tax=Tritrichomonas musculus TaxID=1915356 RepID=A0ABR2KZ67_9EUKA